MVEFLKNKLESFFTYIELKFGGMISTKFLKYGLVGVSGIVVNLSTLFLIKEVFGGDESWALFLAIIVSMMSNFYFNNRYTFAGGSRSVQQFFKGLLSFSGVCSIGMGINYFVATYLHSKFLWNIYLVDIVGILTATIWNYKVNSRLTWAPE